ncbi:hypothetical protein GW7_14961 [Heterocephalus glaber]|uniref:Uncharacterized protein n=1 Tax=Heterocephalus glaber TaxID=10181 RepID=G5C5E9_HETGA|nr:hypothetical protein GW7_14961 [Heterocephalus glaber]
MPNHLLRGLWQCWSRYMYRLVPWIALNLSHNPRCLDGVLIDGNDKGISKVVYRSCSGRDQIGPLKMNDSTWLTSEIHNPLAVGQYVNNCSNDRPANVCYQELEVPAAFPIELKQYLPNIAYSYDQQSPL